MSDMPVNEPKAGEEYTGEEKRLIDPTRKILTPDQKAVLIVTNRFKGSNGKPQRPEDLDEQEFTEDSVVKRIVARLFRQLEEPERKPDQETIKKLAENFARNIATWEEAGIFTEEREARGFSKPDFERDYQPLLNEEMLHLTEKGEGLDKGYKTAIWAPVDVPIHDENPGNLSYLGLLKDALLKAYHGTVGGKAPDTLLVGPSKKVLTVEYINNVLNEWCRYAKEGVIHNVETLDPENHGGVSEMELLQGLTGVEKQTGGTLRLERDQLITPKDLGKNSMSAKDWNTIEKEGRVLPLEVSLQNMKQAIAYTIHYLNTQGWVPDHFNMLEPDGSMLALAPKTYIPDESSAGATPVLAWDDNREQFHVGWHRADHPRAHGGVRGGIRINN